MSITVPCRLQQLNMMSAANGVYDARTIPPQDVADFDPIIGDVYVMMGLEGAETVAAIAVYLSSKHNRSVAAIMGAPYGSGKYRGVCAVFAAGAAFRALAAGPAVQDAAVHTQRFSAGPLELIVVHGFRGAPSVHVLQQALAPPVQALLDPRRADIVICATKDEVGL